MTLYSVVGLKYVAVSLKKKVLIVTITVDNYQGSLRYSVSTSHRVGYVSSRELDFRPSTTISDLRRRKSYPDLQIVVMFLKFGCKRDDVTGE